MPILWGSRCSLQRTGLEAIKRCGCLPIRTRQSHKLLSAYLCGTMCAHRPRARMLCISTDHSKGQLGAALLVPRCAFRWNAPSRSAGCTRVPCQSDLRPSCATRSAMFSAFDLPTHTLKRAEGWPILQRACMQITVQLTHPRPHVDARLRACAGCGDGRQPPLAAITWPLQCITGGSLLSAGAQSCGPRRSLCCLAARTPCATVGRWDQPARAAS